MKVGDVIKFKGTWGGMIKPGERQFGIVMEVWMNGATRKISTVEVLWDNGDYGINHCAHLMETVSESI